MLTSACPGQGDVQKNRSLRHLFNFMVYITFFSSKVHNFDPLLLGWVCYAEKTQGAYILPYISTTKSPQQIMGSLVKSYVARQFLGADVTPDRVYHVTVMPCFDKKLEASRQDFFSDVYSTRDVDCVISTSEVFSILSQLIHG